MSVEEFDNRYLSMHIVRKHELQKKNYCLTCTCVQFHNGGRYCSHILAVYHTLGIINVIELVSSLMPIRKRGRPCNRTKALERIIVDLDVEAMKPADLNKQPVRHPQHLNGFVTNYRWGGESGDDSYVLWQARFNDSPEGVKVVEYTADELKVAIKLHSEWVKECTTAVEYDD